MRPIEITPSLLERFWKYVVKSDSCWNWDGALDEDGYGFIMAGAKSLGGRRAPRVSWTIHYGPIPDGMLVRHRCDNRPCVRPDHLELGSPQDNMDDMWSRGRARPTAGGPKHGEHRGAGNPMARLTDELVRQMRIMRSEGATYRQIAAAFSVGQMTAWFAINGHTWKHVDQSLTVPVGAPENA